MCMPYTCVHICIYVYQHFLDVRHPPTGPLFCPRSPSNMTVHLRFQGVSDHCSWSVIPAFVGWNLPAYTCFKPMPSTGKFKQHSRMHIHVTPEGVIDGFQMFPMIRIPKKALDHPSLLAFLVSDPGLEKIWFCEVRGNFPLLAATIHTRDCNCPVYHAHH